MTNTADLSLRGGLPPSEAYLIAQNGPPPTLGLSEEEIFGLFDVKARPRRAAA